VYLTPPRIYVFSIKSFSIKPGLCCHIVTLKIILVLHFEPFLHIPKTSYVHLMEGKEIDISQTCTVMGSI